MPVRAPKASLRPAEWPPEWPGCMTDDGEILELVGLPLPSPRAVIECRRVEGWHCGRFVSDLRPLTPAAREQLAWREP